MELCFLGNALHTNNWMKLQQSEKEQVWMKLQQSEKEQVDHVAIEVECEDVGLEKQMMGP